MTLPRTVTVDGGPPSQTSPARRLPQESYFPLLGDDLLLRWDVVVPGVGWRGRASLHRRLTIVCLASVGAKTVMHPQRLCRWGTECVPCRKRLYGA